MKANTNGLDLGETIQSFSGGQKILSRYKLDRILGQGGMGVVWLARDEELDRDVALKFLPAVVVNDRASLNDLKRETRRSLELTHPNIVRTYDFVQDSTIAGISMEYVECDTLRNRRVDQPSGVFQPGELGEWTRQLCGALDYAHMQAAIVHRDLKPANLMVNGRNQLKVADFGISRSLVESVTQMTMQRGVSGTLVYMSPQQLAGEPSSPLDDVYALGATLYELLTTRPPFYTGDIAGQIHAKGPASISERRINLGIHAGEIPQNWETTVGSCLAKDPSQRPRSAGEVAVGLGLIEAASMTTRSTGVQPIVAAPPTQPPPLLATLPVAPAPKRPQAAVLASIAAALLALAGIAGWYFGIHQPAEREKRIAAERQQAETDARLLSEKKAAEEQRALDLKQAEAARLAKARGSLVVETIPPGAMVKIGDAAPQRATAFKDLKLGKLPVQISLDGYDPVSQQVEIKEGEVTNLEGIALTRSKGPLQIRSVPDGLGYVIKSKANPLLSTGGVTPLTASDMLTGDYEITVTREGWPSQTRVVTVSKDSDQPAVFEFNGGTVTIHSDPPGAKVSAGGKELGLTPLDLTDIRPGDVQYTLAFAGRDSATVKGVVQAGQNTLLETPLRLIASAAKKPTTRSAPGPTRNAQTRTATAKPKPRDGDEDDSASSGHSHTREIIGGIIGSGILRNGPGFRPPF